ncbi:MAG TPA: UDP-N-acetylmuramoyl-L-alanine--D-glutamate ligase [Solirubrobacteraceae bacterium]|nr:UDP-N-acetylmuramoyl-L-alanine--D-glutamate ligase [Solirubrobacteraceae bacterium]
MNGAARPPVRRRPAHPLPVARARPPLPEGPYAVVGLARSGRAAALALRERGEQVLGLDAGAPEGLEQLAERGVALHTGERASTLPDSVRALIKSPGVPEQAPAILTARARGVPVLGELELGWRLLANQFIAVTGTNGKTTTAELIGHVHRRAGLPVVVAGNVGTALTSIAGAVEEAATIVCEASSFQLEDTLAFAPEAALLVNLTPDHLDRHGSFASYARAKANAFARQHEEDLAVLPSSLLAGGAGASEQAAALLGAGRARRVGFGADAGAALRERDGELLWEESSLLGAGELPLRGRHNLENAMAAAAVCLARGLAPEAVREGLRSFAGVRHRLEQLTCRDGVMFVNDSKATNVASTLVALEAFAEEAGIRLILGGQGKGQDFGALRAPVQRRCSGVYLIGEDAAAIRDALAPASVPVQMCETLERAVAAAARAARAGEVVLLSPACASFDQFSDFEARGERFRELVCG